MRLLIHRHLPIVFLVSVFSVAAPLSASPGSFTLSGNPYCNTSPPPGPAVLLSWSASSNVTNYQLYRNGSPLGSALSSSQRSFDNNANVVAGQTYSYFVRASNSNGSTDSNTVTVTVPANVCGSSSPPGNFTLSGNPYCNTTAPAGPAVLLSWSSSSNVTNYQVYRNGSPLGSVLGSSQQSFDNNANVVAGQTYSYFVRASNSNGSTDSNTVTVTVPANVCGSSSPPGNFTLSGNPYCNTTAPAGPAVLLSWSSSSNVTNYQVYRNGSPLGSVLGSSQQSFDNNANVVAGQTYSYFVRASNSNGSTDSNTVTVTVPANVCGSSSPPGNFTLSGNPYCNTTAPAGPAVLLSWSSSSNVTNYQVYRNGSPLGSVLGSSQQSFDNNANVVAGQTYSYFVRASNSNGSTDSNTVTVTVPANVCGSTSPPGNFTLSGNPYCNTTAPAGPAVLLSWSSSSNVTNYQVYRNGSPLGSVLGSSQQSFDNNANVVAGQTYSYFVRASNSNGSTDSNTVTVTVPANVCGSSSPPGNFTLSGNPYCNTTAPAGPAVLLSWSSSSNVTNYQVYRNGSPLGSVLGSSQQSFDNNANVVAGQTYSYFVRASNSNGSTDSNTVTVTVPANVCGSSSPPGNFTLSGNPYCNTTAPAGPAVLLSWSSSSNVTNYQVYRNVSPLGSILGSSQQVFDNNANVVAGQTYDYFVRASNSNGSTDSNTVTVTVPANVCGSSPPGNFTLSGNPYCNTTTPAGPAVLLSWSSSSSVTNYQVYRNGSPLGSILGSSQQVFDNNANVVAGQTYDYFVRASNSNGSTDSNTVTVTVPANVCGSSPPGNFTLSGNPYCNTTAPAGPAVLLSWSSSSSVTNYQVYRNGSPLGSALGSSQQSFDNNANVVAGQTYSYFVRASNSNGSTDSNTVTVTVPANVCGSSPPGNFTLSGNPYCNTNLPTGPAVLLNWSTAGGANSYQIYRNGASYGSPLGFGTSNFDNNSNISAGQTYSYVIRASNANGTTDSNEVAVAVPSSICSSSSDILVLSTVAGCNTALPVSPEIQLSWTPLPNTTSYTLFRNGSTYIPKLMVTTFDDKSEIVPGRTYAYRVRAQSGDSHKDSNTSTIIVPVEGCAGSVNPGLSLVGRVVTPSGTPVPGISIDLSGATTNISVTNASGTYSFDNLSTGIYTATPRSEHYRFNPPLVSVILPNGAAPLPDIVAIGIPAPPAVNSSEPILITDNAFVFATDIGTTNPELLDLLQSIVLSNAMDPLLTQIGLLAGPEAPEAEVVLQAYAFVSSIRDFFAVFFALHDPLRIVPAAKSITVDQGQIWGPPSLSAPLPLTTMIGLDYIGAGISSDPGINGPLTLKLEDCGLAPPVVNYRTVYDVIPLLSKDDLKGLDIRRSYIIVPRRAFAAPTTCNFGSCTGDRCWTLAVDIPRTLFRSYAAEVQLRSRQLPDLLRANQLSFVAGTSVALPVTPQAESTSVHATFDFTGSLAASEALDNTLAAASQDGHGAACNLVVAATNEEGVLSSSVVSASGRQTASLGLLPPTGWQLQLFPSCSAVASASVQMLHGEHVVPTTCANSDRVLCLNGSRFKVEVAWRIPSNGRSGVATAAPMSDQSGTFSFFDYENVELVVKVLDGRPVNNHFWVFYGALSNVEYWIRVTDTHTGEVRTYHNPAGNLCGDGDTRAFPIDDQSAEVSQSSEKYFHVDEIPSLATGGPSLMESTGSAKISCISDPTTLCLNGNRFSIEVHWRTSDGRTGLGYSVPSTDVSGFFWFFDRSNIELAVKILDGTAINGKFWVFYGALSDVDYTVIVRDTATGMIKNYHNAPGNICGSADTNTFAGGVPGPSPSISAVFPNPVPGSNAAQAFTISGKNFVSGAAITLRDLSSGQTFSDLTPTSISGSQIVINANFTTAMHTWSVEVVNPDRQSSGQFQFNVQGSDTDTVSWTIDDGCSDGLGLRVRFFDKAHGGIFPSAQTYYTVASNGTATFTFDARHGARLCVGAVPDPPNGLYWCYGIDGNQDGSYSSTCCTDMPAAGPLSQGMNLICP